MLNEEDWPNADPATRASYKGALVDGHPADKVKAGDEREITQMKDLHLYSWIREQDVSPGKSVLLTGTTDERKRSQITMRAERLRNIGE